MGANDTIPFGLTLLLRDNSTLIEEYKEYHRCGWLEVTEDEWQVGMDRVYYLR